jgi:hypothetical protein
MDNRIPFRESEMKMLNKPPLWRPNQEDVQTEQEMSGHRNNKKFLWLCYTTLPG